MRFSAVLNYWWCRRRRFSDCILLIVAVGVIGCASTGMRQASRAANDGDWAEAVRLLTGESLTDPENASVHARLGEAQYRLGRYDDAEASLRKALKLKPTLYTAHLYLGYVAEARGDLDEAIAQYQYFVDRKPRDRRAKNVALRAEALRRESAREFARDALANEARLQPSSYPESTIGVVYFRADRLPDSLRPLAKGLAAMTVTDLSKVRSLDVVERMKTDMLLEELGRSQTSAFDTTQAPRYGKLLGAAHVLGGDMSLLGEDRLSLTPALVSSKTGDVILPNDQTGELLQFFRLQKQLVFDVIAEMGIELTDAERDSIGRVPTESLESFLAYSRGLELQDRGMYEAARTEFERAVEIDPGFTQANTEVQQTTFLGGASVDESVSLETFSTRTTGDSEWSGYADAATDRRLSTMLNNTGLVRTTGTDGGNNESPYTEPVDEVPGTEVIIHGRFD